MISSVHLENFGAFADFSWSGHGSVNVVVGENDTGKSHLLKVLYVVASSVARMAERAQTPTYDRRSWRLLVAEKLDSTFQHSAGISALVRHGAQRSTGYVEIDGEACAFAIPASSLAADDARTSWPAISATFVPPKEVLTIFAAIEYARERDVVGFDDTYYDLIKQLRAPVRRKLVDEELARAVEGPRRLIDGHIVRKSGVDEFVFQRDQRSYSMGQTADGIKKLGLVNRLIENRSLHRGSVLFLDEPETNLHPRAISVLTETLFQLGQAGVQVYVATHSYFVIKALENLARLHGTSVPFCSLSRAGDDITASFADLQEGLPDNPIVDESLQLYQRGLDVDLALAKRK